MSTATFDPIPETVADALKKWDAGETVFSVEMGGMGPGYEMAIQGLVFELLRKWSERTIPKLGTDISDELRATLHAEADAIVHECNDMPWGGFSGAQVGAAKSLAICILRRDSYRSALREKDVEDRLIQVSKKDLRK